MFLLSSVSKGQIRNQLVDSIVNIIFTMNNDEEKFNLYRQCTIDLTDYYFSNQYDGNTSFQKNLTIHYSREKLKSIDVKTAKFDDYSIESHTETFYYVNNDVVGIYTSKKNRNTMQENGEEGKIYYDKKNPYFYILSYYQFEVESFIPLDEQEEQIELESKRQSLVEKECLLDEIPFSLIDEDLKLIDKYFIQKYFKNNVLNYPELNKLE